jgi:polysaccharide biosynthesis/export protein
MLATFARHCLLLIAVGLCACSTAPPIVSSALPPIPDPGLRVDRPLSVGDIVAIDYFPSSVLEATAYVVGAGDLLRVDVFDHPELSRERVLVLPDGHISAPLVNRLPVVGKNVQQIAQELAAIYRQRKILDPAVIVSVEQADARIAALMRSVTREGRSEPVTVMVDELGYLDLAFIGQVSTRQPFGDVRREVIERYRQQFGARLNVTVNLRNRQPPVVYVIGEVVNPGGVNYTYGQTPLMAVAAAGGLKATALPSDVRVYRYRQDGSLDQWSFDIGANLSQGNRAVAALQMAPQDVVYVQKSGVALANTAIDQYIRQMVPFQIGVGATYLFNP